MKCSLPFLNPNLNLLHMKSGDYSTIATGCSGVILCQAFKRTSDAAVNFEPPLHQFFIVSTSMQMWCCSSLCSYLRSHIQYVYVVKESSVGFPVVQWDVWGDRARVTSRFMNRMAFFYQSSNRGANLKSAASSWIHSRTRRSDVTGRNRDGRQIWESRLQSVFSPQARFCFPL